jgi:hypothetical protein
MIQKFEFLITTFYYISIHIKPNIPPQVDGKTREIFFKIQ